MALLRGTSDSTAEIKYEQAQIVNKWLPPKELLFKKKLSAKMSAMCL